MSERFKLIPAVYVLLQKKNSICLIRRYNTGYMDGKLTLPSGHFEGDETAKTTAAREAFEEVGVQININDLELVHTSHRLSR